MIGMNIDYIEKEIIPNKSFLINDKFNFKLIYNMYINYISNNLMSKFNTKLDKSIIDKFLIY